MLLSRDKEDIIKFVKLLSLGEKLFYQIIIILSYKTKILSFRLESSILYCY